MEFELISSERQPRQQQDALCREILKVRGRDGHYKCWDLCKAAI
jgi:hypothetical protein